MAVLNLQVLSSRGGVSADVFRCESHTDGEGQCGGVAAEHAGEYWTARMAALTEELFLFKVFAAFLPKSLTVGIQGDVVEHVRLLDVPEDVRIA